MKKLFGVIVIIGIISLLSMLFVPGIIAKNQSENVAKKMFQNLIEQNYEKAFESIYYFDRASGEPNITYEEAKSKWVQRVKELKEKGVYLIDYHNLSLSTADRYEVVGTVDLVFIENGKESEKRDVQLRFFKKEGKWKLGLFSFYDAKLGEEWDSILSGFFNE